MHCICKTKKGDFGILVGAWPLCPPKSAYDYYYDKDKDPNTSKHVASFTTLPCKI